MTRLHNEAYCLFKSGWMKSLCLMSTSLFDNSKRTAPWVRTFCSPLELLYVWSTAYRPDNSKDCAFWNTESFLVSWHNCCQICLFIVGATKLVQFSGLRYLLWTLANLIWWPLGLLELVHPQSQTLHCTCTLTKISFLAPSKSSARIASKVSGRPKMSGFSESSELVCSFIV